MSKDSRDSSSASNHLDSIALSSPEMAIESGDCVALYDATKTASHVLQQFFHAIETENNGIKSAKCLICRMIVKQSPDSTFNYKRHVERKHKVELDQWQAALQMKKRGEDKKQAKVRESFLRKSE